MVSRVFAESESAESLGEHARSNNGSRDYLSDSDSESESDGGWDGRNDASGRLIDSHTITIPPADPLDFSRQSFDLSGQLGQAAQRVVSHETHRASSVSPSSTPLKGIAR